MAMELLVIGSGTAVPHPKRTAPGLLLKHGKLLVLIDPGPGAIHRLAKYGIDYREINEVWITHPHLDHHADLAPLLFARKNAFDRLSELAIRSGEPFERILESLEKAYGHWLYSELSTYCFKAFRTPSGEIEIDGLRLKWQPVEHSDWAFGLRMESKEKSLAYSGDSDFCDSLVELAKGADLLVAECSSPDDLKIPGHMTSTEVGKLAEMSCAKKLLLVHLYPECDPTSRVLAVVRKHYCGDVEIAKEGKLYVI